MILLEGNNNADGDDSEATEDWVNVQYNQFEWSFWHIKNNSKIIGRKFSTFAKIGNLSYFKSHEHEFFSKNVCPTHRHHIKKLTD